MRSTTQVILEAITTLATQKQNRSEESPRARANEADTAEVSTKPIQGGTSGPVCFRKPDGLVLSTGTLHFTSRDNVTASV
jgi:hypothetical protein